MLACRRGTEPSGPGFSDPGSSPSLVSEMNRLKEYLEEPEESVPYGDFWVIYGEAGIFYVTAQVAGEVARRLERWWTPRWITFVDVAGAPVRLRGREIQAIYESTQLQRSRERSFHRARRLEEKADRRPWEDDD